MNCRRCKRSYHPSCENQKVCSVCDQPLTDSPHECPREKSPVDLNNCNNCEEKYLILDPVATANDMLARSTGLEHSHNALSDYSTFSDLKAQATELKNKFLSVNLIGYTGAGKSTITKALTGFGTALNDKSSKRDVVIQDSTEFSFTGPDSKTFEDKKIMQRHFLQAQRDQEGPFGENQHGPVEVKVSSGLPGIHVSDRVGLLPGFTSNGEENENQYQFLFEEDMGLITLAVDKSRLEHNHTHTLNHPSFHLLIIHF